MLTSYICFLTSSGESLVPGDFNIVTVRQFIIHEQERKISPYSVQGKVRALKAFAPWLCDEGYTSEHSLKNLKPPKVPVNLIEPLTNDEIEQLLSFQNQLTTLGCRNITVLVTLLDTELRLSELYGLQYEDAHIDGGYFKVMGKGSKERMVHIGGLAQKMLWRYIIDFRPTPLTEADSYLFLTPDGK